MSDDILPDIPNEPEKPVIKYKYLVGITEEVDAVLKFAGDGNRSRGVRELARLYMRLVNGQEGK